MHLKTHTNLRENAYKLCKISYKARKCIYTHTKIHKRIKNTQTQVKTQTNSR